MVDTQVQQLARWVASVSSIPLKVQTAVVNVVVDAVSAAVAGHRLAGAMASLEAASRIWGLGNSTIWFASRTGSLSTATFANSMAASILDLDDGHRAAAGHPGAAIVPAVLAAAESLDAPGDRVLTAIAIGYEVGIRIAAARDLRAIDTLVTGRWCGQGVAAAIGWLRGDDADQIAEAIAIAGAVAPYMFVAEYTNVGNHTKEAIPFGAVNGILAGTLASSGFKGPLDILDHKSFDPGVLAHGSPTGWYIETTYFKPYSCCRWIHAPIDAVLLLRPKFDWTNVAEITVDTFERTMSLNNQITPQSVQAAQYSTPFCVAAAVINGPQCLQPMSDDLLEDDRVRALASKVRLNVDPRLDAMFPASVPGRVKIVTDDQTLEHEILAPKGEATNPMSWDELMDKLSVVALPRLGGARLAEVRSALEVLRATLEFQPLLTSLKK
jgi:2-methylcitrate dehydratase PrpD